VKTSFNDHFQTQNSFVTLALSTKTLVNYMLNWFFGKLKNCLLRYFVLG